MQHLNLYYRNNIIKLIKVDNFKYIEFMKDCIKNKEI